MDDAGGASPVEKEHLQKAHDEICTALTVLRSNVDLVRVELAHAHGAIAHPTIDRHLGELDAAVDRLRDLARQMRRWHGPGPRVPRALTGEHDASVHP